MNEIHVHEPIHLQTVRELIFCIHHYHYHDHDDDDDDDMDHAVRTLMYGPCGLHITKPLDYIGREYKYTCHETVCTKRGKNNKKLGYKSYCQHVATEHGMKYILETR